MSEAEFKYMKEGVAADLAEYLKNDFNLSYEEALRVLYDSDLYAKLCNPSTGLYFQGSRYIYSFLLNELQNGVLG